MKKKEQYFSQYYKYGTEKTKTHLEWRLLNNYISRNWKEFQKYCEQQNNKAKILTVN